MRTRAAILTTQPGKWEIAELELEPPRQGELLVRMVAAGLCHSDDHLVTGDLPVPPAALPLAGGHEGAGVVEEVGPNTAGWTVGDHVVLSFLPACGHCKWCASGMQNLCDNGARILTGVRSDGTRRLSLLDGTGVGQAAGVSTFSEYSTVAVESAIKISPDIPLEPACLTSCGVGTGWGSAVNSAEVKPGHVVIVVGVGGIGMSAVQGAYGAGAAMVVAVDPVPFKQEIAPSFGATHAVATIAEAADLARSVTNGQGADSCIICVGVATPQQVGEAVEAIRKAGTVVLTGLPAMAKDGNIPFSMRHVTLFQKRIQGSLYGAMSPMVAVPALLDLYRAGRLKLDEMITRRYALEEINQGYEDMRSGQNVRGVVTFGS
jgi:NDMA-dependent alcohol dehydrogenase